MLLSASRSVGLVATAFVIGATGLLSGCLTTAAALTVVRVVRSDGGETAAVEMEAPPQEVYEAMLRVVDADPQLVLDSRDDRRMTLWVSQGKKTAMASAKQANAVYTRLTVTAKNPEDGRRSADLAARAVTRVCEELGVSYQVVEQ